MKRIFRMIASLCCLCLIVSPTLSRSAFAAESNKCGEDLVYSINGSGTLIIRGNGSMYTWDNYSYVPWYTNRSDIKSVLVEEGVTTIGSYAFYGCYNLERVTIAEGVTDIQKGAFWNCTRLKDISIPNGVIDICEYAFYGCKTLTSMILPDGLFSIGDYAFSDCSCLENITIPESVSTIGKRAFQKCSMLTHIKLPSKIGRLEEATFISCTSLHDIAIPKHVDYIGKYAFRNCESLETLTIPWSTAYIGEKAFYNCPSLKSVYYTGTLQEWQLIDVEDDNLPLMEANMIMQIIQPEPDLTIYLPLNLATVESQAFIKTDARYLVIPKSVTYIADDAFPDTIEYVYGFNGSYADGWTWEHLSAYFIEIDDEWINDQYLK